MDFHVRADTDLNACILMLSAQFFACLFYIKTITFVRSILSFIDIYI